MSRGRTLIAYGLPTPPPFFGLAKAATVRQVVAILAAVMLFGMLVIGTKPLQTHTADPATALGDSTRQLWYVGIFVMLLLGSQFYSRPARLLVLPLSMIILFAWSGATLFWSADPAIGMRRLMLTVMLAWCVFRICDELGYRQSMALFRIILVVALALNYLAILISPLAIHQHGERVDPMLAGCWRGFLYHKNFTGALCAVTVLAFVFGERHWRLIPRILVLGAAAYFLYRTGSKTSFNLLFLAIAIGWVYLLYSLTYRALLVPALMIIGSAGTYYVTQRWGMIVAPLYSPDQSLLTGRIVIWPVALDYWYDHPWGAGFGSFWNVGLDGPVFSYARNWVTQSGNGHNGYLDLLITIGPIGLGLALLALYILPVTNTLTSQKLPRGAGAWAVAVLAFCAGHNLTETTMLDRDAVLQICLMYVLGQVATIMRHQPGEPHKRHTQLLGYSKSPAEFFSQPGRNKDGAP